MGPPEVVQGEYGAKYLGSEAEYYLEHILGR
jgi:hypothetical protein